MTKKPTPEIQALLNRCRKRLEKAQTKLDVFEAKDGGLYDTFLRYTNDRDALLHIVREMERVYGLEPKDLKPTLVEELSRVLSRKDIQ